MLQRNFPYPLAQVEFQRDNAIPSLITKIQQSFEGAIMHNSVNYNDAFPACHQWKYQLIFPEKKVVVAAICMPSSHLKTYSCIT